MRDVAKQTLISLGNIELCFTTQKLTPPEKCSKLSYKHVAKGDYYIRGYFIFFKPTKLSYSMLSQWSVKKIWYKCSLQLFMKQFIKQQPEISTHAPWLIEPCHARLTGVNRIRKIVVTFVSVNWSMFTWKSVRYQIKVFVIVKRRLIDLS